MSYWHALPNDWEMLTYKDFLYQRRKLMASVIKDGFKQLETGKCTKKASNLRTNDSSKGLYTEFKSTLRVNLHTGQNDKKMEHAVLKTINGFLNSMEGGSLVIGVDDEGTALGLKQISLITKIKWIFI